MNWKFLILFLTISFSICAQSVHVDYLKRTLPALKGNERADCFNDLAYEYIYKSVHSDSAWKYACLALDEANAVNYTSGKGVALIRKALITGRLLGLLDQMETYSVSAIKELEEAKDLKNLSDAYGVYAHSLIAQGRSADAYNFIIKALMTAESSGDVQAVGWALFNKGFFYAKKGEYWKAFENLIESQRIGRDLKDSFLISLSTAFIARSYNNSGDPEKAVEHYLQALQYVNTPYFLLWAHLEDLGYAYRQLNKFDSALYYQQKHKFNIDSLTTDEVVRKNFKASLLPDFVSDVEISKMQFDKVIARLKPALINYRKNNDMLGLMYSLLAISKAYEGKKQFASAIPNLHELIYLANKSGNNYFKREGYGLLFPAFENLNKTDSAYYYYKQFVNVRDEINSEKFALRTALYAAASEADKKYQILNKEKEIGDQLLSIKENELHKQSQLKNLLILGVFILSLITILIVRNIILKRKNEKLEHEQKQASLRKRALELEMQALRAQMNPHFIFNCLSAIDNLVQTQQSDVATTYLSRFAKLIRAVLESSKNNLVPFQKDFEAMQLYLELEQFRCNYKFNYKVDIDNQLLNGDYKVPPLIIQPFIENAIHHGLLNKAGNDRELQVSAFLRGDYIEYLITDNGIGRKKAAILKEMNRPEHQSYGIGITTERINLHNKTSLADDVHIADLEEEGLASGTKATVRVFKEA
jgi:tetratricopeptide (TPR) repeat protein/anti-sigma regulatory factor (Ser/Thr protein kinase)